MTSMPAWAACGGRARWSSSTGTAASSPPSTPVCPVSRLIAGLVDILKINASEFRLLYAARVGATSDDGHDLLVRATQARELAQACGLTALALTDGGRPAVLVARVGGAWAAWAITVPRVTVATAIGAGDTTAAGMLIGLLAGLPTLDAFRSVQSCRPSCQARARCGVGIMHHAHARRLRPRASVGPTAHGGGHTLGPAVTATAPALTVLRSGAADDAAWLRDACVPLKP
jgi:hypothetical protein